MKSTIVILLFLLISTATFAVAEEEDVTLACKEDVIFAEVLATTPPARVAKTGQWLSVMRRDDGFLRKGVAWPIPRFVNKGNGTILDKLTGLLWVQDAGCIKFHAKDPWGNNVRTWDAAIAAANGLGDGYCGLTDGSAPGYWRLPNVKELLSLIDYGNASWAEQNAGFLNAVGWFWSSTSVANCSQCGAWRVHVDGSTGGGNPYNGVWAVH